MSRQRLGQNFLFDKAWQKKIADLFEPVGAFGEIGPGHGEITEHLLKRYPKGFAIFEKDSQLAAFHRMKKEIFNVIEGDFLDWDFYLNEKPVEDFSLIGNLPYESGTAMVIKIAEHSDQISEFLFMLQKEVVERLTAKPKSRAFGSLSVLVQGQFDLTPLDVLPPNVFRPAPEVDSQLVRGRRKPEDQRHPQDPKYRKFLKEAFLLKRKTFRNALKSYFLPTQLDLLFKTFELSPTARAEEIGVDLWPNMFQNLMESNKQNGSR